MTPLQLSTKEQRRGSLSRSLPENDQKNLKHRVEVENDVILYEGIMIDLKSL